MISAPWSSRACAAARLAPSADSPEPIDVIGHDELQLTGHAGLKETLGALVPSLTLVALSGGGTSASVRPYAYRGLSGDYLLVLVNGKRRHNDRVDQQLVAGVRRQHPGRLGSDPCGCSGPHRDPARRRGPLNTARTPSPA